MKPAPVALALPLRVSNLGNGRANIWDASGTMVAACEMENEAAALVAYVNAAQERERHAEALADALRAAFNDLTTGEALMPEQQDGIANNIADVLASWSALAGKEASK